MRPPFRRVLVANRGEIAVRVIRACHEVGAEAVAVFSDADADAPHVRVADAAVRIGPPPAESSYLSIEAVMAAARQVGAEAIHPGYGFLSERAAFARACDGAGIVFVGPSAETLAGLGDKLAARRAARSAGVPVVPGTLEPAPVGDLAAAASVLTEAARVGWPLMVKAAAGGGGRGMRRVDRADDLPGSLLAASQEARAAFGDGAVYLERYVHGARHVEVQLLGDAAGRVVALGERDCSVQRRHQKLVEEAPAPGLTAARRRELHEMAVAVARAFALRNAATAEFLLAPDGSFWFLEVNTRLQVEHGVTELVSDLDIVQEQLWIAAGEPLSRRVLAAARAAATPRRHAIEVRISAEDPGRGFAPASGSIGRWRAPGGPGVRVDAGVDEGSVVGTDYDPLLAKLMVVASDRRAALARLRRALDEFDVTGIQTTLPFHRWIAADPAFAAARLSTSFVPDNWHPEALKAAAADRAARLVAAFAGPHGRLDTGGVAMGGSAMGGFDTGGVDTGGAGPRKGADPPATADRRLAAADPPRAPERTSASAATDPWLATARREAVDRWPG